MRRHTLTTLLVSVYLLAVSQVHCRALLAGLGKTIGFLLLAGLFMFLVVRSADICRNLTACLQALQIFCLPLLRDLKRRGQRSTPLLFPQEPALLPIFERPPPIFS